MPFLQLTAKYNLIPPQRSVLQQLENRALFLYPFERRLTLEEDSRQTLEERRWSSISLRRRYGGLVS